jgi:hypothetical protein
MRRSVRRFLFIAMAGTLLFAIGERALFDSGRFWTKFAARIKEDDLPNIRRTDP